MHASNEISDKSGLFAYIALYDGSASS